MKWIALALLLVGCSQASEPTPSPTPSQAAVESPSSAEIRTDGDRIREALAAEGFTALSGATDSLIRSTADDLCEVATTATSADEGWLDELGAGFAEGVNESGFNYTEQEGTVIVELFLQVYCPDVLDFA